MNTITLLIAVRVRKLGSWSLPSTVERKNCANLTKNFKLNITFAISALNCSSTNKISFHSYDLKFGN